MVEKRFTDQGDLKTNTSLSLHIASERKGTIPFKLSEEMIHRTHLADAPCVPTAGSVCYVHHIFITQLWCAFWTCWITFINKGSTFIFSEGKKWTTTIQQEAIDFQYSFPSFFFFFQWIILIPQNKHVILMQWNKYMQLDS